MWRKRTEAKENSPCETQYPSTKLLFSYLLNPYTTSKSFLKWPRMGWLHSSLLPAMHYFLQPVLSSSKHIWMPRTLIKQLSQKSCLNSSKPERIHVDCNLHHWWHEDYDVPCVEHHLLGPFQITHMDMPEHSCGQHHPFINLGHSIGISKRILWNNIKGSLEFLRPLLTLFSHQDFEQGA